MLAHINTVWLVHSRVQQSKRVISCTEILLTELNLTLVARKSRGYKKGRRLESAGQLKSKLCLVYSSGSVTWTSPTPSPSPAAAVTAARVGGNAMS